MSDTKTSDQLARQTAAPRRSHTEGRRLVLLAVLAFGLAMAVTLVDILYTSQRLGDLQARRIGVPSEGGPALTAGLWREKLGLLLIFGLVLAGATYWLGRRPAASDGAEAVVPSLTDPLTGLPNRYLFDERLQRAMTEAERDGRRVAVIMMDLVHFRGVNDAFGRDVGDQVLSRLAQRMRSLLRDVDTVARLDGDEFGVLARIDDPDQAQLIAAKLLTGLSQPCELLGSQVAVRFNVGMAYFPDHGRTVGELVQHAELAVDLAADSPDRCAVYAPERDVATPDRLALLARLPDAIREGQLRLIYQPKQYLRASKRRGYEALVRWRHPAHGELGPGSFLPLAEQTGAIMPLTHWAIDEALKLLSELSGGGPLEVAVNLSARALDDEQLPAWLARRLADVAVKPGWLRLEVTESSLMSDSRRAMGVLGRLAALGLGISLDDFGVGHSSLAYLAHLPVDELKIDQSFVTTMLTDARSQAIVRATVDLAHDLGLRVVAEGVETGAQAEALERLGCDVLQGHWVGMPLTAAQVRAAALAQA